MHKIDLIRHPKAATPDDDSILGPAPPEIQQADVIPPIVVQGRDRVVFLRRDGTVGKVVALKDDPNLEKRATPSPNGLSVAVSSEFSSRVIQIDDPTYEGGSIASRSVVYDRDGNQLYSATGTDNDSPRLSDGGKLIFDDVQSSLLRVIDAKTGNEITDLLFLEEDGGCERVSMDITPSGSHFVAGGNKLRVPDGRGTVPRLPQDILLRGVSEAWVGLFDGNGRQIWKTKLPDVGEVERVAVSPDGQFVFASALRLAPGPLTKIEITGFKEFILDGQGRVVASNPEWGGHLTAEFDPRLGAFVLDQHNSDLITVARPDGTSQRLDLRSTLAALFPSGKVVSSRFGRSLHAFLLKDKRRLVLVLVDSSGRVLLSRVLGRLKADDPRGAHSRRDHDDDDDDRSDERDDDGRPKGVFTEPVDVRLSPSEEYLSLRSANQIRTYRLVPKQRSGRKEDRR